MSTAVAMPIQEGTDSKHFFLFLRTQLINIPSFTSVFSDILKAWIKLTLLIYSGNNWTLRQSQ